MAILFIKKKTERNHSSGQKKNNSLIFVKNMACSTRMVSPLPANERTILRLIRHLRKSGVTSTIKVYLLAIRSLHVQEVFPGSFTWMSSNTLGFERFASNYV